MKHYSVLDISLYQIQLFLSVAETRNFSRAALRMNIAQPTLSKRISLLEDVVGVQLFHRDKRPLELTPAGELLLQEWQEVYDKFENSIENALSIQKRSGKKLAISTLDSTRRLLAIHLAGQQLEHDYPGFAFSWEYNSFINWRSKLYDGEIDIMLTVKFEEANVEKYMAMEPVMVCPKLVCMLRTNPLSNKDGITYQDLKNQKFIITSQGASPYYYDYVRKICGEQGFKPKVARYASNANVLISSLKNDDEVVVCDTFLRDIDSPLVKLFPLPETHSGLIAVWKKGNPNPYIQPYIKNLKRNFIEHQPLPF